MTFVLEAVRTLTGSSLLLHFGMSNESPSRILIDCGSGGSYQSCLRPRLEQLRGDAPAPLPLHMILACQMDKDHLAELSALMDEVSHGTAPVRPKVLWMNEAEGATGVLTAARTAGIAINPPFETSILMADTKPISQGKGLSIEVLAPHDEDPDQTAPIILARKGDQSMLIAGNAPGPRIADALVHAGYLDQVESKSIDDPFHVNLMAITQHGSNTGLTNSFFQRVTADSYLFAGNTSEGNPDIETLEAIGAARREDDFNLYFAMTSNDQGASQQKRAVLDWVAQDIPDGCVAHFREDIPDRYSTLVELPA